VRVAVTGAAGFLGANVVRALVGEGHEVVAIDRVASDLATGPEVTWINADILDPAQVRAALDGVEVVYHLVAVISLKQEDPLAWRVNVDGVATVARAALEAGVRRMVNCGSLNAFRYAAGDQVDESSPRSTDPRLPVYNRSKYAGELELLKVVEDGLDALTCNPTGIYGPVDQPTRLSRLNASLLDAAKGRVPVAIKGAFDMVDVRDVARGFLLAAEKGRTGENYLLTGHRIGLPEINGMAAIGAGHRAPRIVLPLSVLTTLAPFVDPIARRFGSDAMSPAALETLTASPFVDGSKARDELGYEPRPTEETVRDLLAFFVEHGILTR
jgi:dihydroflavonol-4-reductase